MLSDGTTPGSCPQEYSRTVTWNAIDARGNVSDPVSQTIEFVDDSAPAITQFPGDIPLTCDEPESFTVAADDNCSEVTLSYVVDADHPENVTVVDLGNGSYQITATGNVSGSVTFTATDECGHVSEPSTFDFFAECFVDEGCTPGYWKQPQHFGNWPAPYTPCTPFSDVFENAFPDMTLLDVLEQGGGGLNALGRHSVAALLNASSPDVSYYYTEAEVIDLFNAVFPGSDVAYEALKNEFAAYNEAGCPLGRSDGSLDFGILSPQ